MSRRSTKQRRAARKRRAEWKRTVGRRVAYSILYGLIAPLVGIICRPTRRALP